MLLSTRRILTLLMCAALIAQAFSLLAFGQSSSTAGSIGGTVVDQSGGLVSAANVTARNTETGQERSAKTGSAGEFRLPLLPLGSSELVVTSPGFCQLKRSGITMR